MKINIVDKKENPLLKRTDYIIEIDYEGKATPSRNELQSFLAAELKAVQELIEVSKIFSEVGLTKGKAWVKVWKEKPPERKKKHAKKKVEEKPVETPKTEEKKEAEKPKEEVKTEERKEEEKKAESVEEKTEGEKVGKETEKQIKT